LGFFPFLECGDSSPLSFALVFGLWSAAVLCSAALVCAVSVRRGLRRTAHSQTKEKRKRRSKAPPHSTPETKPKNRKTKAVEQSTAALQKERKRR
jgi:hypothetical protein